MDPLTHQRIEHQEIIERYVRNELSIDERRGFQEHYFSCDDCFAQVETMTRFIAGIRDAAGRSLLEADISRETRHGLSTGWLRPAFVIPLAASFILAIITGWLLLYREPMMRKQLAQERQSHEQIAVQSQQNLKQAEAELLQEREARAKTETQLAGREQEKPKLENRNAGTTLRHKISPQEVLPNRSESNIPLAMLEATRDSGAPATNLDISPDAKNFVLWIEVSPEASIERYRLEVYGSQNKILQTLRGLRRNSYGALAVSFTANSFPAGSYRIKLYADNEQQIRLMGEYRLKVRKL